MRIECKIRAISKNKKFHKEFVPCTIVSLICSCFTKPVTDFKGTKDRLVLHAFQSPSGNQWKKICYGLAFVGHSSNHPVSMFLYIKSAIYKCF